jgi:RNA polymerase sigma-70 factor (ECF subfamily)
MPPESVARQLWRRAKAGEESAFEQLFSIHTERLLVFIRGKLGPELRSKVEAADVLQDAYISALARFADFDYTDEGAFLRWLCRIIDNRLRDAHDHFTALKRQVQHRPVSAPTGPVSALARAENQQRIAEALESLSTEHREVILLRYFEGLSAEETGQRMGRSQGAVGNLLSRALIELGKRLKSDQESKP